MDNKMAYLADSVTRHYSSTGVKQSSSSEDIAAGEGTEKLIEAYDCAVEQDEKEGIPARSKRFCEMDVILLEKKLKKQH